MIEYTGPSRARVCVLCRTERLGRLAWWIWGICKGCRLRRSMS